MTATPTTRYSLLLAIRDPANQAAWSEFVALYEPLVYRLARRKGLQDADARDLCQEVFRAVAGAATRWLPDPERGSFRGWLAQVTKNRALNALRQQRRQPRASGDSDWTHLLEARPAAGDAAWQALESEYRREVFQIAARSIEREFTRPTWEAFWQTAIEGRDAARVAAELGLSRGAVYIAKSRVLARLRQEVQRYEGEDA